MSIKATKMASTSVYKSWKLYWRWILMSLFHHTIYYILMPYKRGGVILEETTPIVIKTFYSLIVFTLYMNSFCKKPKSLPIWR